MPDIFDEVEEEVRAERMRRLLTRFAPVIVGAVLVILAGIVAWHVWDDYQVRQDQKAALLYLTALNQVQTPGADAAQARIAGQSEMVRLAQTGPAGYRSLARLRAAGLLAHDGKTAEAARLYNVLITDPSADPLLRDVATLLWAELQIDSGDPQILESRLKPLTGPGSAWRPLAERELALLALRQNKTTEAITTLKGLALDPTAPAGVRESAQLLLQQLGGASQ